MLRRIIGGIYQGPERLFLLYASFARLGNFESDKSEQEIIAAPPPRVPTAGHPAITPEEEVQWLFRLTGIPEPSWPHRDGSVGCRYRDGRDAGGREPQVGGSLLGGDEGGLACGRTRGPTALPPGIRSCEAMDMTNWPAERSCPAQLPPRD
jgi:hypothetical protein